MFLQLKSIDNFKIWNQRHYVTKIQPKLYLYVKESIAKY